MYTPETRQFTVRRVRALGHLAAEKWPRGKGEATKQDIQSRAARGIEMLSRHVSPTFAQQLAASTSAARDNIREANQRLIVVLMEKFKDDCAATAGKGHMSCSKSYAIFWTDDMHRVGKHPSRAAWFYVMQQPPTMKKELQDKLEDEMAKLAFKEWNATMSEPRSDVIRMCASWKLTGAKRPRYDPIEPYLIEPDR